MLKLEKNTITYTNYDMIIVNDEGRLFAFNIKNGDPIAEEVHEGGDLEKAFEGVAIARGWEAVQLASEDEDWDWTNEIDGWFAIQEEDELQHMDELAVLTMEAEPKLIRPRSVTE